MELVCSESFMKSLARLDPPFQAVIKIAMFDLQANPRTPGFALEKLVGTDFYSGRINDNLRLIMDMDGDRTVALYVDTHDDAYRWANNHKLQINKTTGAMQLVYIEHITEQVIHQEPVYLQPKLFDEYSDDYLLALGVPEDWLLPVKESTKEHLEWLIDKLPSEAMERLLQLDDGKLVPIPRNHDGNPLDHPDSLRHFLSVKATDDLSKALASPWAQWTVFLHPDQRDLVNASFSGPVKVSGTAGTGKTVVAVHRAFRLAQENPCSNVLLTTFSRALATRITQMVATLSGGDDKVPGNLTISTIHSQALQIWSRHNPGIPFKHAHEVRIKDELESAIGLRILGPLNLGFILSEWNNVIDNWGLSDWASYRTFPRAGRGTVLGQRQREELWSVFGPVLQNLGVEAGEMTFSQLAFSAAALSRVDKTSTYQHVVVDEIQDFGPAEMSLTRSLVSPGTDDLFLCGDAGQRIFRRTFSWSSVGIQVQGRARHLYTNYRNTEQIQTLANTVLSGPAIGGDGGEEDRDAVSLLTGAPTTITVCEDKAEEILCLGEWLQDMIRLGYSQDEIAIFSRRSQTLSDIGYPALRMVGQLNRRDLQDSRPPSEDGVSFGTMHRAKGLEFRAVAIIGCGAEELPDQDTLDRACDESEKKEILEQEKNLLYVALTRPRERLLVTCTKRLSTLLPVETDRPAL